jgi:hypothetical protein
VEIDDVHFGGNQEEQLALNGGESDSNPGSALSYVGLAKSPDDASPVCSNDR